MSYQCTKCENEAIFDSNVCDGCLVQPTEVALSFKPVWDYSIHTSKVSCGDCYRLFSDSFSYLTHTCRFE